jgi:hypothetical protein
LEECGLRIFCGGVVRTGIEDFFDAAEPTELKLNETSRSHHRRAILPISPCVVSLAERVLYKGEIVYIPV